MEFDKFRSFVSRGQTPLLGENSLYDGQSKAAFVQDDQKIVNAFLFNFVGTVAAYEAAMKKDRILKYIRSDLKLKVDNVTDDNNDTSLVIKLMSDKGFFKTDKVANQMTRFLAKLKQGGVDDVDPSIVQGWLNSLSPGTLNKTSLPVKRLAEDLLNTGDLLFFAERMRDLRKTHEVSGEFSKVTRGVFFKKSGRTKLSDPAGMKNANSTSDGTTFGTVDNSRQHADGRSSIDGVGAPGVDATPDDPGMAVSDPGGPDPQGSAPDTDDPVEAAQQILRGTVPPDSIKWYKLKPDQKKDVLANVLYSRPPTKYYPLGTQLLGMVGIAEHLNKSHKVEIADAVSRIIKDDYSGRGSLSLEEAFARAMKMVDLHDAIEFTRAHAKSPVEQSAITGNYTAISTGLWETDPDLRDIGKFSEEIKTLKRLPSDHVMNVDQALEMVKTVSPNPVDTFYLAGVFLDDDPARAKAFIESTMPSRVKTIAGKTVFVPREGLSKGKFDPWATDDNEQGSTGLARFLESIGIHPIGNTEKIFKKLDSDAWLDTWTSGITEEDTPEAYYKKDPAGFRELLGIIGDSASENFVMNAMVNYKDSWVSDPATAVALKKVISRNSDSEILREVAISFLTDNGSGPIRNLSLLSIAAAAPEFLVEEVAGLGISYIKNNFDEFTTSENMKKAFRISSPEQQKSFVSTSAKAKEPDFPKWFVNKWHEEVMKLLKGGVVANPLGLTPDILHDPGDLISILTDQQIEDMRAELVKTYADGEVTRAAMEIASQGGQKTYTQMSDQVKELVTDLMEQYKGAEIIKRSIVFMTVSKIMDKEFFDKYVKEKMDEVGPRVISHMESEMKDGPDKEYVINEYLADPGRRKKFVQRAELGDFLRANENTLFLESEVEAKIVNAISETTGTETPRALEKVTGDRGVREFKKISKDHKAAALKEALKIIDDPNTMAKSSSEYRDSLPSVKNAMLDLVEEDRFEAERIYAGMTKSMRRQVAGSYLQRKGFIMDAQVALTTQTASNPIISTEKLDSKRIKEILKYNNVVTAETKIKDSEIKNFDAMDAYIESNNDVPFEPLRVEELEETEEELEKKSARYHSEKRNNRHGTQSLRFVRSFDVAIPIQQESQAEWLAETPDQEVINPMFHGTGSTAASMILRYGFRVIKSGDPAVVGRMLGDGVYGAIHIDKAQQYIGDSGFSRRIGTRGYIFEMNAALGEKGKDYEVAGLGNDHIRSPEWCVFSPNHQFRIFRAHEVEIVSQREMQKIQAKAGIFESSDLQGPEANFNDKVPASKQRFSRFYEGTLNEAAENYATYTFVNGVIPTGRNEIVDFEDFSPTKKNVFLEPSAYGPTVVVRGSDRQGNYMLTSATDLAVNHPEVFEEYLKQVT